MKGPSAHCFICCRDFANIVDKTWSIVYDKCLGQKCPECKKIKTLKAVEITYFSRGALADGCPKCKKKLIPVIKNGLCPDCFWESEKEKGCICILDNFTTGVYCYHCKKVHLFRPTCKECLEKRNWLFEAQQGKLGWFYNPKTLWIIFLTVIFSVFIGFVVWKKFGQPKRISSEKIIW